jgi:hypothetical protein
MTSTNVARLHKSLTESLISLTGTDACAVELNQYPAGSRVAEKEAGLESKRRIATQLGREARLSLAHSEGTLICAGVVGRKKLGIDLEPEGRQLSDAALQRISNDSERQLGLQPIELWSIKEACFKANPASDGTVVSQYQVLKYAEGRGEAGIAGEVFTFILLKASGWVVVLAQLR